MLCSVSSVYILIYKQKQYVFWKIILKFWNIN